MGWCIWEPLLFLGLVNGDKMYWWINCLVLRIEMDMAWTPCCCQSVLIAESKILLQVKLIQVNECVHGY